MNKQLVILTIGSGDFNKGFDIDLQLFYPGRLAPDHIKGFLPPAPDFLSEYEKWLSAYQASLSDVKCRMEKVDRTPASGKALLEMFNSLKGHLNTWLNTTSDFTQILLTLTQFFTQYPSARFFLRIDNNSCSDQLKLLPWHLWSLFDKFRDIELAFVPAQYENPHFANLLNFKLLHQLRVTPVKILALFGYAKELNLGMEQDELKKLGVEPVFDLTRSTFMEKLREDNWDILYFAGHSHTENEQGKLWISENEYLELSDVKHSLQDAIQRGLKLAIFNSCQGLGLAQDLQDLHIPEVLVMRELIPDPVAQIFLKHFLQNLQKGNTALALRRTREILIDEGRDKDYPGVSWLPILFANPATESFVWPVKLNLQTISKYFLWLVGLISILSIGTWWGKELLRWRSCGENLGVVLKCPTDWRENTVFGGGNQDLSLINSKYPGSEITFSIEETTDLDQSRLLEDYTAKTSMRISKENPQVIVNNPQPDHLGEYPAYRVGLTINGMPDKKYYLWSVINDRVYVFSLTKTDNADISQGEEEKVFRQMVQSFELKKGM